MTKLPESAMHQLVNMLSALLADVHQLYIKTLGYHWNVEDTNFLSFHKLFEGQYEDLAKNLDEIAERIRMLGKKAPSSLSTLQDFKRLEDTEDVKSAKEMVKYLYADYTFLIGQLRKDITLAESLGDPGTVDMCVQIVRQYEKAAWFLKSHGF